MIGCFAVKEELLIPNVDEQKSDKLPYARETQHSVVFDNRILALAEDLQGRPAGQPFWRREHKSGRGAADRVNQTLLTASQLVALGSYGRRRREWRNSERGRGTRVQ